MAVVFACTCGRRLKARHCQRGYISFCPGCGAAVKVPTGKATHRGVAALSEAERLANPFPVPTATPVAPSNSTGGNPGPATNAVLAPMNPMVDVAIDRPPVATPTSPAPAEDSPPAISFRGRRRSASNSRHRDVGETWFESARYTLPACPILLLLALFLAASSGAVLRSLADSNAAMPSGSMRHILVPSAAMLLGFLACACAFLGSMLSLSLDGSPKIAGFPNLDAVLRGTAQWTACFLAGPALLLAVAAMYWISFGDPALVDDIILAELVALSFGWFLAALMNTSSSGRFWQFHPAAVLGTARSKIGRFAVTSLAGTAFLYGLARFGMFAIARVHLAAFEGFLWLGVFWVAALVSTAFAFRRLGLRHHGPAGAVHDAAPVSRPARQRGSRIALSRTPV